jgi:hypothetical protein
LAAQHPCGARRAVFDHVPDAPPALSARDVKSLKASTARHIRPRLDAYPAIGAGAIGAHPGWDSWPAGTARMRPR